MLHTKFHGNPPAGFGEDFLKGFLPYMGHVGHVTSIMSSDFHMLVPGSFHTKFGSVVSEKIRFEFCMCTTLGQGQEMTLTFNTHIPS